MYPKKELPFFILFTAGLCSFTAMLAMLTHQFPELMGVFAKAVSTSTAGSCFPITLFQSSDISAVFVLQTHLFTRPSLQPLKAFNGGINSFSSRWLLLCLLLVCSFVVCFFLRNLSENRTQRTSRTLPFVTEKDRRDRSQQEFYKSAGYGLDCVMVRWSA